MTKRVKLKPSATRSVRLTKPRARSVDPELVGERLGAEPFGLSDEEARILQKQRLLKAVDALPDNLPFQAGEDIERLIRWAGDPARFYTQSRSDEEGNPRKTPAPNYYPKLRHYILVFEPGKESKDE